jgi:hypothetical protein
LINECRIHAPCQLRLTAPRVAMRNSLTFVFKLHMGLSCSMSMLMVLAGIPYCQFYDVLVKAASQRQAESLKRSAMRCACYCVRIVMTVQRIR